MAGKLPPESFEHYFALGPSRSYAAVAKKYGVTKKAVYKRALKERWQERIADIQEKARAHGDEKRVESIEAMNERHLKLMRLVQGKALEALKQYPLETALEAVRALEASIRQERLICGEPSERAAVSVEDVIKREYQSWMTTEVPEDDTAKEDESG